MLVGQKLFVRMVVPSKESKNHLKFVSVYGYPKKL